MSVLRDHAFGAALADSNILGMFCVRCAQELPDTARFCLKCGLAMPVSSIVDPVPMAESNLSPPSRKFPFIAITAGPNCPKLTRKQWTVAIFVLGILLSFWGWGFGLIVALAMLVRSAKYLSSENQEGSHLGLYLGVILLMADCLLWFVIRR